MLIRIIVDLLTLTDSVLDHFVTSVNVTTEQGEVLAGSISSILLYGSELYAQLLLVFSWVIL